jgi:hypothetical protein
LPLIRMVSADWAQTATESAKTSAAWRITIQY